MVSYVGGMDGYTSSVSSAPQKQCGSSSCNSVRSDGVFKSEEEKVIVLDGGCLVPCVGFLLVLAVAAGVTTLIVYTTMGNEV